VALEGGEIPKSDGDWDPPNKIARSELGKGITAKLLTMRAGKNMSGSSPYDTTPVWDAVSARPAEYVRGHLLNHNIHGPGSNKNMAPITITLNNEMKDKFETKLKEEIFEHRKVMRFSAVYTYATTHPDRDPDPVKNWIDEEKRLPTKVSMEAQELVKAGTTWTDSTAKPLKFSKKHSLPPDHRPAGVPAVNINTGKKADLDKIPGIGTARADAIIALRKKRKNDGLTRFNSYDDLKEAGIPQDIIDWLKKKGRITLYEQP
jgi:DNA uptake protein ComE-like DNA-binding protein